MTTKKKPKKQPNKNTQVAVILVACVALMGALAYASVPLYTLFCKATGFGGTTQTATSAPASTKNRTITVSFDGNVDPALPWEFAPMQHSIKVKLGQTVTVKYRARNMSNETLTATATDNVQPDKTGPYFDKIQCFCFKKHTLKAGESVELPVQFFIDPSLADDSNAKDVHNITLSYTFFLAKHQVQKVGLPVQPMSTNELENTSP
jgi:cytochrome c oxidase assembly protein subunit 11